MKALQERVQRGIAQLDQYAPDWRQKVDSARLDMSSSTNGLLEQVFGGTYYYGLKSLHVQFAGGWDYGFDILSESDEENVVEWEQLTDAWKAVLGKEQEGATGEYTAKDL